MFGKEKLKVVAVEMDTPNGRFKHIFPSCGQSKQERFMKTLINAVNTHDLTGRCRTLYAMTVDQIMHMIYLPKLTICCL
jgi:hypothetical protein